MTELWGLSIHPMLTLKEETPFTDPAWIFERKESLADVFENTESAVITDYVEQEGEAFYRVCRERGLEGIIAKRKDSRYLIGRRGSVWKKIKALKTVDCVIAGVTVGEGNRADT